MSYDYVIIGAGSAGRVLAAWLPEDPATTVLLEVGPPDRKLEIRIPAAFSKLFRSEVDWDYATVPAGGCTDHAVGPAVVRLSSINAKAYVRGDRADFDNWAATGNPGGFKTFGAFVCSECNSRVRSPRQLRQFGITWPPYRSPLRSSPNTPSGRPYAPTLGLCVGWRSGSLGERS